MIEQNNKQLLNEIKKGDHEAFEFLFKNYYPRLLGYATRFIEDKEIVRDIIQECFMKLWEKRETLQSVSEASLLFAMVRNACLDYLKHYHLEQQYSIEYLANIEGEERLYHADFSFDPDRKLLYDELQEQIRQVIDQLPPRCKEVFLLSRFENLKNKEIAEQLHISLTAVEKHISKAISVFDRHFKDRYPIDTYIIILAWLIKEGV
jgi:RNA polymerase sigma-70 factor (ECF subfamily)